MADPRRFYITTAISYPNGEPHIGHAYEALATDALARWHRLDGADVRFVTGTDEHGLKMVQTAHKLGLTGRELADRNAPRFERMVEALGCSNDAFIRTSDAKHYTAAQALWAAMEAKGDIYKSRYTGWYSVRDEAFYGEEETTLDGEGIRLGPQGTPVEWTEEESYFFRLSNYQDRLLRHYEAHPEFVSPAARHNEVASFVRSGLQDLSISRTTFDWGVPVPGDPDHVMYVWVDALTNYLTALGYPDTSGDIWQRFWPANLHVIGKDIVRFHAVYWPAFLMSADLPLPERVFGHGFLFNRGQKMSKSVGNVVDPFSLIEAYGRDQLRYFLLREVPFGQDGNYSHDAIVGRINADLANDIGNLGQRSLSMIAKNCDGALPEPTALSSEDRSLLDEAYALLDVCRGHMRDVAPHKMLSDVFDVVGAANAYMQAQEPWKLKKTDPARMGTVLYVVAEVIRICAILLQPVMPEAMSELLDLLGVPETGRAFDSLKPGRALSAGTTLPAPSGVFPRYVEPELEAG